MERKFEEIFPDHLVSYMNDGREGIESVPDMDVFSNGDMTLVIGPDTKEGKAYLVAVEHGHPTICTNTASTHTYSPICGNASFYWLENDTVVERTLKPGETITLEKGTPFTYCVDNNDDYIKINGEPFTQGIDSDEELGDETVLGFLMQPAFDAENDFSLQWKWEKDSETGKYIAPPVELFKIAKNSLPTWRQKMSELIANQSASINDINEWNGFVGQIGRTDGNDNVVGPILFGDLGRQAIDYSLEAINYLASDSSRDLAFNIANRIENPDVLDFFRRTVLKFSINGPQFYRETGTLTPEEETMVATVESNNAQLAAVRASEQITQGFEK